MFGLTKREQYWKASQKAAETMVDLAKTVMQARSSAEIDALREALRAAMTAWARYADPFGPLDGAELDDWKRCEAILGEKVK
jgi:predicted lipoprotein